MTTVKAIFATAIGMVAIASAGNLAVGSFSVPYRFEDGNISDLVRHVVTNDVIAYTSATTAFTPPFHDTDGTITMRNENTPVCTWHLSPLYEHGIAFVLENGQTNCVIRRSLTDAAKALEAELPMRTNLTRTARIFLDSIANGTITNKTAIELRSLTRIYKNNALSVASEADISDADVLANFVEIREHAAFLPLTILDASYLPNGTNTCYLVRARVDTPNEPEYARSISVFPITFADGFWSLCAFPY